MNYKDLINVLEGFKISLISRATGGEFKKSDYIATRQNILSNNELINKIPRYIKSVEPQMNFGVL